MVVVIPKAVCISYFERVSFLKQRHTHVTAFNYLRMFTLYEDVQRALVDASDVSKIEEKGKLFILFHCG